MNIVRLLSRYVQIKFYHINGDKSLLRKLSPHVFISNTAELSNLLIQVVLKLGMATLFRTIFW